MLPLNDAVHRLKQVIFFPDYFLQKSVKGTIMDATPGAHPDPMIIADLIAGRHPAVCQNAMLYWNGAAGPGGRAERAPHRKKREFKVSNLTIIRRTFIMKSRFTIHPIP
jgi:hypothetical protein